MKLYILFYHWW